jgi:hypothetical protein
MKNKIEHFFEMINSKNKKNNKMNIKKEINYIIKLFLW